MRHLQILVALSAAVLFVCLTAPAQAQNASTDNYMKSFKKNQQQAIRNGLNRTQQVFRPNRVKRKSVSPEILNKRRARADNKSRDREQRKIERLREKGVIVSEPLASPESETMATTELTRPPQRSSAIHHQNLQRWVRPTSPAQQRPAGPIRFDYLDFVDLMFNFGVAGIESSPSLFQ